jgi:hypothetical protein
MSDGLDPTNLTPAASLNRVRFTELPGLELPDGMVGWAAYALLSARALASLTARHGEREAARRFGERLGWLLATLMRGDPASRAARPDWDDSYWRHWASIGQVYLGGGLVSGAHGTGVAEHAGRILSQAGLADCSVAVAPWPEHLAVIGAARAAPDAPAVVVLDFGHSFVKRACALYEDGALATLGCLPRLPATWTDIASGSEPAIEDVRRLAEHMVETMAGTVRAALSVEPELSRTVCVSIASYVRDGRPLPRQGGAYPQLLRLSEDVEGWLSDHLSEAVGKPMSVRLLHDGTAAARAMAGQSDAAVITLGTALGIGFPPPDDSSRPISPRFVVRDARDARPSSL